MTFEIDIVIGLGIQNKVDKDPLKTTSILNNKHSSASRGPSPRSSSYMGWVP